MGTSKKNIMSAKWRVSRQGAKKIFGDDIYLFIHLPALYLTAILFPHVPDREGTNFLELKLNRQIFNPCLFHSGHFTFLQTSELNLLNI